MKKYILAFIACIYAIVSAGQAIGQWKTYPALQIATDNVAVNNKIYSLCNGNLFSYNTDNTEIYVYDKINGLHDVHIKFIRYCLETQKLVAVYENGNVDIIYPDDEITNLKQIKDKNYTNLIINNVVINGKTAYLCTNFGIIELDLEKEVFSATYNLDMNVKCGIEYDNHIYISTDEGCYKGDMHLNLLDKANWKRLNNFTFDQITLFQNELVAFKNKSGLYKLDKNTFGQTELTKGNFTYFSHDDNVMIAGNEFMVNVYKSLNDKQQITFENTFNQIHHYKGTYWASQNKNGLQPYKIDGDQFTPIQSPVQPNSPVRDYFCNMHYDGDRLLIAGGDLNYSGIVREATIMYYENDTWYNFIENNVAEQVNLPEYVNVNSIAQDPKDPTHHFVSTPRLGLYEYKDLKFIKKYDYTNSKISSIYPGRDNALRYIGCSALNYDNNGNLWMMNNSVDTLFVILKSDNTWTKLYYPEIAKSPTCNFFITFDRNGNVWFNSQRMEPRGIFFLDYNGTLEDTSDDIHLLRKNITNQDGVEYTPDAFYCIVEDLKGKIWIGTNIGPFVISEPEKFANEDFTFTQVKISRNDGTEYADYLLSGVEVRAIAIDGANRKWIGTSSDGVYLVSEDGQEMLQHFTTENSPLLSDEIQSLAVNPKTGEVMMGTGEGLVSYMSDANTPKDQLEKDNISVYPNPVTPDFNGPIAVSGLTADAEVKITTVTGQLVYSGHSKGGLFTWNGRNKSGKRVSSGIYNVITTNAEGKKTVVTRITFIH